MGSHEPVETLLSEAGFGFSPQNLKADPAKISLCSAKSSGSSLVSSVSSPISNFRYGWA